MGVRILNTESDKACMYDSITMTAFGPVLDSYEDVENFIKFAKECGHSDPRYMTTNEMSLVRSDYHKAKIKCDWCDAVSFKSSEDGEIYNLPIGWISRDTRHGTHIACSDCAEHPDPMP